MRRGRGGFGGYRGGFGQSQALPITPIETYIYNPNCEEKPQLSDEEKQSVILSRIVHRFCNEGEYYVHDRPSIKLIRRFTDELEVDIRNSDTQRQLLVDAIGFEYFPNELLTAEPDLKGGRQVLGEKKELNWKSLEAMEKSGTGEIRMQDPTEDVHEEERDTQEHEDYGHNHYEDEDREDEYIDDANDAGDEY